jgi:outer membrane protein assembly factor BamD (BamD/ComL family)
MIKDPTTPDEAKPEAHHHDELAEVKQLIQTYAKPVVTGFLAVIIAVGGFQLYASRKQASAEEASRQWAAARSIPNLEDILTDHPKSEVAPMALLALAKLYYQNGNYEIALTKYDDFIRKNPTDRAIPTAQLGRLFCIEARGSNDALTQAAEAYAAFATESPESFLTPQALFGQARCLEQLGQAEAARTLYEDFISAHSESAWMPQAETLLEQIKRRIKAASQKTVKKSDAVIEVPATTPPSE